MGCPDRYRPRPSGGKKSQKNMDRPSRHPRLRLVNPLIPAVLGVAAAGLLGGAGFGLGCIYAQLAVSAPAVVTQGMGGPEELAPLTGVETRYSYSPRQPGQSPAKSMATTMAMTRPVVGGWVSSHFGQRRDPFTGRPAVHRGLDFAGLDNSAILAVAPGVVTWSGRQRGYGNLIEIDHGNGWVTRYGHNSFNLVTPGDYVKLGQTIALMGSTGRATGIHLHFEVLYRGRYQNPSRFVPQDA